MEHDYQVFQSDRPFPLDRSFCFWVNHRFPYSFQGVGSSHFFRFVRLQNHDTADDKKAVPHLQKWQTAHFPYRDFWNCGSHCNSPNRDFVWLVLRQCVRCWQCQNCGHCASDYKRHSFQLVHCALLISHEFLLFFLISPTGEKGSEADSLRLSASSNTQY